VAKGAFRANLLLKLSVEQDQRTVQPVETGGHISYLFKTFFASIKDVSITNLLCTGIFSLPLIFLCFFFPDLIDNWTLGTHNFIGNFGIGYPGYADNLASAISEKFIFMRTWFAPFLAPAIILFFIGLAGLFHCARGLMWGEKVKPAKSFFRGIKRLWKPFLITGVIVAGITEAVVYASLWHIELMELSQATAGSWIVFILMLLIAFIVICLLIFLLPTFACYRFSYVESVKNACILCITMIPTTLFMAILSIGIVLLSMIATFVAFIVMALFMWLGFYLYASAWTDYAQYTFDNFIVPQVATRASGRQATFAFTKKDKKKQEESYVGAVATTGVNAQKKEAQRNAQKNQGHYKKYKRK